MQVKYKLMPLRKYIALLMCVLLPFSMMAQMDQNAEMEIVSEGDSVYYIHFSLGNFSLSKSNGYAVVTVEGMDNMAPREGLPALPVQNRLFSLPKGASMQVEQWKVEATEMCSLGEDVVPFPWQGATVKGMVTQWVELDKTIYDTEEMYVVDDPVTVTSLGVMGDRQVCRLTVSPVAFIPQLNSYRIATNIAAKLSVKVPASTPVLDLPEGYLVVSRPEFQDGLQSFVRWKRQTGYDVKELYVDTHKRDSVKAKIRPFFDGATLDKPAPRYILIVGDATQIQAFVGTTRPTGLSSHITDLYYAEYTDDFLPDAIVGRWPVNDTAQLRAVVEKTLRYERAESLDSNVLRRMLLVAGSESRSPAPTTTNGQVNYVGKELKAVHPEMDTLCYHNPSSADHRSDILADMAAGVAALNYTAHCSTAGWSSPSVSFGAIDTLAVTQPLLYVNNCCESNDFGGTCFGEQLLRKANGGAIGVIGATNSTLWNEDYYWAVGPKYPFTLDPQYDSSRLGAFDRWIGRAGGAETQGELLLAGNMAVSAFGSPYEKFYWEIYCLLGDPSLIPYIGTLYPISIAVTDSVTAGDSEIILSATPGVRVGVIQADSLLAAGRVPDGGVLTLALRQSVDTGRLVLTATGGGFLPRIDTIRVSINAAGMGFYNLAVTDSTVSFAIGNNSRDTLRGINVCLRQESIDSASGAILSATPIQVDSLLPWERRSLEMPYRIERVGRLPLWTGRIVTEDTAVLGMLQLWHGLRMEYPELMLSVTDMDSHLVGEIHTGHEYLMHVETTGEYDSLYVNVDQLPEGLSVGSTAEWATVFVADSVRHLHVSAEMQWDNWRGGQDGYIVVGQNADGFEHGLNCYPWQGGGTRPWTLDNTVRHTGRYSIRSGAIGPRQTSDLIMELSVLQAGPIVFYVKASSEELYDKMEFMVDGVAYIPAWGEMNWTRYSVPLSAGYHLLKWRYSKDESTDQGSDCVWIDDVQLPVVLWDSTYGCQEGEAVSIDEVFDTPNKEISIYPNPSSGRVKVKCAVDRIEQVLVVDIYGRSVYVQQGMHADAVHLDLEFLPKGMYMLQVRLDDGIENRKLIIK